MVTLFFNEGLALFHAQARDAREAIHLGSELLLEAGCVVRDFERHVWEREKQFPTGLDTEYTGVAIPHTDSAYVRQSQIAFVSLSAPVEFRFMADAGQIVQVGLVLVLAMSRPHEQVEMLSSLMTLISSSESVATLCECSSTEELKRVLARHGIR